MNNRLKLILIAIELFALAVLVLLGMSCQQRWVIITGDGPRFDWYAIQEDLTIDINNAVKPDEPTIPEPEDTGMQESQPSTTPPETTRPAVVPETTAPLETTEPEESTEETTESTTPSTSVLPDNWETDEF